MEARANNDRHRQRQQKLKEQVDTRVAAATEKKGILIVFTGNGKGKSTAAFGTATRALVTEKPLASRSLLKVSGIMASTTRCNRSVSNFILWAPDLPGKPKIGKRISRRQR